MSHLTQPRIDQWLSRPVAPKLVILAGILFALPSIRLGFFADDDALIAFLAKRLPFNPPWYDLYRFAPGNPTDTLATIARGQLPWWTAPELRLHLVRPLSSALFALDHALYGTSPVGYHLSSIAWFGALLVAVHLLFKRILPSPTATLALLLFAITDAAVHPYSWISARHALVAAAPAVFGLVSAVRAREDGWAPGRWLAPLGMVVGLAGGEMGLGGLAFWVSYEAFGPARASTWKDRISRAALPIGIGLAYLAIYAAVGGGARASGGYVDPSSPRAFGRAVAVHFPALLDAALVHLPAELATILPTAVFVVTALVCTAGVTLLWRACASLITEPERAAVRWLLPGALASMLGAAGGFPGSRELLVANLGWAALFAILIRYGFRAQGSRADGTGARPVFRPPGSGVWLRRAGTGLVVVIHLLIAPLFAIELGRNVTEVAGVVAALAHDPAYAAGPADRHVIVAQASDPTAFLYPIALRDRESDADAHACFCILSAAKGDLHITRTGKSTLMAELASGSMLRGAFETLYRAPEIGFRVGDDVAVCEGRVRVLAVDEEARPTRIELSIASSFDDPRVRIVAWRDGGLRTIVLGVGAEETVAWSPGPLGMF